MDQQADIVGIVGAGLIGRSWANVFARAGWRVQVWDPSEPQRAAAHAQIAQSLHDLQAHGLVDDSAAAAQRVQVVATLADAVRGARYVQESGPETLEVKLATFAALDAAAPAGCVLASSTSAIVASQFTADLAGRDRCIVAHPVNPPHLVPVVELCGAPWTSADTKARADAVMRAVGQVPIDVKREIDGFVLNRLQVALLTEAFRLVQEGVVSPKDLDHTIADGLGLRWAFMGPFETIELNAPGGIADYCQRYTPWFRRYMADLPTARVWDDDQWQKAADAWGPAPEPADVARKSLWRNDRLAALAAHKRGRKPWQDS
ncbi:3-hydroxyacyl-CoA dehydrogenase [Ideonella sp. A 288]|uniref:3-hydroxyacyl-CoA dehydrogenase n=1 Tax=Ideonella sp. A 288 TaxID=1962181 RepID=UPI000B4AFDA1|nr:3-hydroxyacyl-CoA dehydrogenase [Ideonella sp. A 288]